MDGFTPGRGARRRRRSRFTRFTWVHGGVRPEDGERFELPGDGTAFGRLCPGHGLHPR
ncbi:MAG: hypothetical protein MZU95_07290 [Desulfomicrobium escambiense]|nr:hypothetical protein [Desulfomicrobium escambiense]